MMGHDELDERLSALRPKLHRYCARMTGSVIDGEDVVQDAMMKASAAFARGDAIDNLESWLFRVAHNAAIDFLRRRERIDTQRTDDDPDMLSDSEQPVDDIDIVEASLSKFMQLPSGQRSAVILMDVLGYRLQEICAIMHASLPAVKSALRRGRLRLRELARESETQPMRSLSMLQQALLKKYVERFNARDFDAIRDMLAAEVRLELVDETRKYGKAQVETYFENYELEHDWSFAAGFVEDRPAIIVCDPKDTAATPSYFVLLDWEDGRIVNIRDFRYARYVCELAEMGKL
jgi:RNA polymerase sigma-70 factor (ECF subfamily)